MNLSVLLAFRNAIILTIKDEEGTVQLTQADPVL